MAGSGRVHCEQLANLETDIESNFCRWMLAGGHDPFGVMYVIRGDLGSER